MGEDMEMTPSMKRELEEKDRLCKERDDALLRELIEEQPGEGHWTVGSLAFRKLDARTQKKSILQKYLQREPKRFHQVDAFFCEHWDYVIRPDDKGVGVMAGETFELMSGVADVRVLIVPGSPKEKVIHALRSMAEWIERDPAGALMDPEETATWKIDEKFW